MSPLVALGGGALGGAASVVVAEKIGISPIWAGAATGGASLAGRALVKDEWAKQMLTGAATGAFGLVGVQLAAKFVMERAMSRAHREKHDATEKAAVQSVPQPNQSIARSADGTDFITRDELQSALSKVADQTKQVADQSKQQHCDLLTALDQITKIVAADQAKTQAAKPVDTTDATPGAGGVPKLYTIYPTRGASVDDERNGDERDSDGDDYLRNAYASDDERNAAIEEDLRNAEVEERNADERDADGEARDSDGDERNADEG